MNIGIYFIIFIVSIFIWEIFPLRKWFYYIKGSIFGTSIRFKIKSLKRYNIIRIILDFSIFFIIFEWNNGYIADIIKLVISKIVKVNLNLLKEIIDICICITPIGRKTLEDNNFRFAFIICTICTILGAIIFIVFVYIEKTHLFLKGVASFIFFIVMWNIMYGICHFIIKISIFYKVLAFFTSILSSFIVWFILMIIIGYIVDSLDI